MNKNELTAQIALGTLSNAQDIASAVRNASDPRVLTWAARHSNSKVRKAVAANPLLPFGPLISLIILEDTMVVQTELKKAIKNRLDEIYDGIMLLESYPQLTLPLKYAEIAPEHKKRFAAKLLRRMPY